MFSNLETHEPSIRRGHVYYTLIIPSEAFHPLETDALSPPPPPPSLNTVTTAPISAIPDDHFSIADNSNPRTYHSRTIVPRTSKVNLYSEYVSNVVVSPKESTLMHSEANDIKGSHPKPVVELVTSPSQIPIVLMTVPGNNGLGEQNLSSRVNISSSAPLEPSAIPSKPESSPLSDQLPNLEVCAPTLPKLVVGQTSDDSPREFQVLAVLLRLVARSEARQPFDLSHGQQKHDPVEYLQPLVLGPVPKPQFQFRLI